MGRGKKGSELPKRLAENYKIRRNSEDFFQFTMFDCRGVIELTGVLTAFLLTKEDEDIGVGATFGLKLALSAQASIMASGQALL